MKLKSAEMLLTASTNTTIDIEVCKDVGAPFGQNTVAVKLWGPMGLFLLVALACRNSNRDEAEELIEDLRKLSYEGLPDGSVLFY